MNSLEMTACTRFTPTVRPLATSVSSSSWTWARVMDLTGIAPQAGSRCLLAVEMSSFQVFFLPLAKAS